MGENVKTSKAELLNCPFCDSDDLQLEGYGERYIVCITCGTIGPSQDQDGGDVQSYQEANSGAAEAWNTRAELEAKHAWQPISTFPKDKIIDVISEEWGRHVNCRWRTKGWRDDKGDYIPLGWATHWKPITPPPPEQ